MSGKQEKKFRKKVLAETKKYLSKDFYSHLEAIQSGTLKQRIVYAFKIIFKNKG